MDVITGVQSAFTYAGAADAEAFHRKAVVGVQTAGGYVEGRPRG